MRTCAVGCVLGACTAGGGGRGALRGAWLAAAPWGAEKPFLPSFPCPSPALKPASKTSALEGKFATKTQAKKKKKKKKGVGGSTQEGRAAQGRGPGPSSSSSF